jgi:hypothetical protein
MNLTPVEKLKLAKQITVLLDESLEGKENVNVAGAEVLFLALKARVPMDMLKATFQPENCSTAGGPRYNSL